MWSDFVQHVKRYAFEYGGKVGQPVKDPNGSYVLVTFPSLRQKEDFMDDQTVLELFYYEEMPDGKTLKVVSDTPPWEENKKYQENKRMSNFKKIMEGISSGKIQEVEMPTPNLNKRTLSLDEVKELVKEEFEKAKQFQDAKGGYGKIVCGICKANGGDKEFSSQEELEKHLLTKHTDDDWSHAGMAKPQDWMKSLSIKEFFIKDTKENK